MVKFINRIGVLVFIVCVAASANGQTGTLSGKVNDEQTGEEIVGANILIVGTRLGATTDIDGKYQVRNLPFGTYSVRISYVGYTTKVVSDVVIKSDEMLILNAGIAPVTVLAEEVTVTAQRVLATESALLSERKKANAIGDGLSAEQIKRAPDATSGDALKRVTGLSIVDNKFVYIRGITDRYNNTTLNGSAVTSTESDKKGFSFDMLPSNLIENTIVVKSATPDLPGDFTGGLVQLNTLDFPDQRVLKLSLSSSYNSATSGKEMLAAESSSTDWLGFDNGVRAYPGEKSSMVEFGKSLGNTWAPKKRRAPYNGSLALSFGDQFTVGEENHVGFISSLSYKNGAQHSKISLTDVSAGTSSRLFESVADEYSVLWGGIANFSYKFAGAHKISFKNTYNHSAEDKTSFSEGYNGDNDEFVRRTTSFWSQRSVYSGQLTGDHNFAELAGLNVQWKASASSSSRRDPDRRDLEYTVGATSPDDPYIAKPGERSWARLDEKIFGAGLDLLLPIESIKLKGGFSLERRDRSYSIRYFQMDHRSAPSLAVLPIDHIYAPENFGAGKFSVIEISKPSDKYSADQNIVAGYVMADAPFIVADQHFRFVGGARVENARQNVLTTQKANTVDATPVELRNTDILPSVNLAYIINDVTNVRLAYSQSVNRPEFRELSSVSFYDFETFEYVVGNTQLRRALARNYDVRFEMFPKVGEVLAVSYFQKRISSPIEQSLTDFGAPYRSWFNSDNGVNYGWEFECRKSLDFLGGYFSNFLVNVNYTRIFSKVEFNKTVSNGQGGDVVVRSSRPLQGQSPYMINVSLLFTEPTFGSSINVLYNRNGERLDAVVIDGDGDIFEQPRDVLDLAFTQPLVTGLEAKFTIKDVLGNDIVFARRGETYRRIVRGTTYGLSVSITL
jgi:hypothetical protein